jgi:hypothetical protein
MGGTKLAPQIKISPSEQLQALIEDPFERTQDVHLGLSVHLKLSPLHQSDPKLWNELLQILKTTRDFMTHPTPDACDFNQIVGDAIEKHAWGYPAKITTKVIQYFYSGQQKNTPAWLEKNQEFRFDTIRALALQPKV